MSEPKRLYLIDGYSNIFRAYYAIRGLSSSKGEPTNAIYGFLQMLRKLLREEQPEYLGVALDVSRRTVRTEKFEAYKAQRAPMPEDLRPQIPWIRRLLEAFRIPLLELASYEADDVLGTLAKKASERGFEVVLLSPDKDLFQLVGERIELHHTGRDRRYDARLVEEDFGVPPSRVADVLALAGDSVDNVPGVPGIGDKGAKKLIGEFGSLEELLERASEVGRKSYREGLLEHRDQALLSKELVTIHTDLPLELDADALRLEEPEWPALIEICRELDFHSVLKELEEQHGDEPEPMPGVEEAVDAEAWRRRVGRLAGVLDVGVVPAGSPVALGVVGGDGRVVLADLRRTGLAAAVRETLRGWLGDAERELVGHDLKEVLRLAGPGTEVRARLFDTMLGSYLLRPDHKSHELADVALERLRYSPLSAEEAGWTKGDGAPEPGTPGLASFVAQRAVLPQRLAPGMRDELEQASLDRLYADLEEPLIPVLVEMEEAGILLDVDLLRAMSEEMAVEIQGLETEIYTLAGEEFNINSPQQLGVVLFEKLGYPILKRTRKTRSYSTGADTLEELAARGYPLPERLLRYREMAKLKSTYVDALPSLVGADGRLHTRFNQAVAATGRLSSAQPNLQNIPVRTAVGQRIRQAFLAPSGRCLVVADYSQIELRILAHIAGETAMIAAFREGRDIHAATAGAVFGVAPELVSPDQRRMAKVINFGIIYGMSAFGLSRQLGIGRGEAAGFIRAYMERYPGVERYAQETLERVREEGKVATLYGRLRWLPDVKSRNHALRENAKRMAINARIQGTAADVLKRAMIAVFRRLRREEPEAKLLLTVHDELVVEAPEGAAGAVGERLREEMEGVAELSVPLEVEVGAGRSWSEAKR